MLSDAPNATGSEVAARLLALRQSIARRAIDCGRTPESVKLVAVSKTFSADEVLAHDRERRPDALR